MHFGLYSIDNSIDSEGTSVQTFREIKFQTKRDPPTTFDNRFQFVWSSTMKWYDFLANFTIESDSNGESGFPINSLTLPFATTCNTERIPSFRWATIQTSRLKSWFLLIHKKPSESFPDQRIMRIYSGLLIISLEVITRKNPPRRAEIFERMIIID